jgi:hypothetical protein
LLNNVLIIRENKLFIFLAWNQAENK